MPLVNVFEGYRPQSKVFTCSDGYFYHKNRESAGIIYLRCAYYHRGCLGRAMCSSGLESFWNTQEHNGHRRHLKIYEIRQLRRNILQKAASRHPARFSRIVEEESKGFSRGVRAMNHAVRLRSAMRRARLRCLPNIPHDVQSVHEILTSDRYKNMCLTMDGDSYIYAGMSGPANDQSLIFMSSKQKKAMGSASEIFCDGTEDGQPAAPQFRQIFSICTTYDGQIIPLCVCLMQRRDENSYLHLFRSIKRLVPNFYPRIIHCDFETAQYNAWGAVFPEAKIEGCLFHYAKAVSEHIRKLKFRERIMDNYTFRSIMRSALAIPLAPNALEALVALMRRAHLSQLYHEMRPFFKYLHKEWINKRGHVLSVCDSSDRTNNIAESWNSKLQSMVVEKRTNIYQFLDGLLRLEDDAVQNIYCQTRGISTNRPRKLSAVQNDGAIRKLTRLLRENRISLSRFLRRASYCTSKHFHKLFPEDKDDSESDDTD